MRILKWTPPGTRPSGRARPARQRGGAKAWLLVGGVVLLLMLVLGLMPYGLLKLGRQVLRPDTMPQATAPEQGESAPRFVFTDGVRIRGSDQMLLAWQLEPGRQASYGSKSGSFAVARNYAFVGPQGAPRWLYPHQRFLVSGVQQLADPEAGQAFRPTRVVLFVVHQQDGDADEKLTTRDPAVLLLASPDGQLVREVLQDVRRILVSELVGPDRILLVVETRDGPLRLTLAVRDFAELTREALRPPG